MPTPLIGSSTVVTSLTGNALVDSLLDGNHWASSTLSYSFIDSSGVSYYASNYPDLSYWASTRGLSVLQQNAAIGALQTWTNLTGINLVSSVDNSLYAGTVRIGFSYSHSWANFAAETYLPNNLPSGGDLWLNPNASDGLNGQITGTFVNSSFGLGSYAYFSLLHEMGHALGLKHPFDSSGNGGGSSLVGTPNIAWDSRIYTIMSYTPDRAHPDAIGFTFNPTTPMLLDVMAIQSLYGVGTTVGAGDTTYAFTDAAGARYFQTIWDGGGTNTISYSGTHSANIDLRAGYGSTLGNPVYEYTASTINAYQVQNVWIAYGTNIQVLDLSACRANYSVTCNDLGDTVYAGTGIGNIVGGKGNDTIYIVSGNASIAGGGGVDTLYFSGAKSAYGVTYANGVFSISSANGIISATNTSYFHFNDAQVLSTSALTNLNNVLTVGSQNPTVQSTSANDAITGQSPLDTVIYHGPLSQYSLAVSLANNAVVQDKVSNRDGTDSLVNIERLKFSDINFVLDTGQGQVGGEAYRLYQAAFNRAPDPEGLGFWIYSLDHGNSLNNVAQGFLNSPEFTAVYGVNSTNATFLSKMYTNVLGRSYDQTGYDFWLGALNNGLARNSLLAQFSESPENSTNLAPLIGQGVQYKEWSG